MRLTPLACALACAASLTACALLRSTAERAPARPVFSYGLRGPAEAGVVQAFTYRGDTYVQFMDIARARPQAFDGNGAPVASDQVAEYLVVAGQPARLSVHTAFGAVLVYSLSDPPRAEAAPAVAVPALTVPRVAAALPGSASAPAATPAPTPTSPAAFAFEPADWTFDSLSPAQQAVIVQAAQRLKAAQPREVRVIGYSDDLAGPLEALRVSERRAESVARALRAAGLGSAYVWSFGRGPRDPAKDCRGAAGAEKERCAAASRRVVIEAAG